MADPAAYRVPRNFKLLAELEAAEKGKFTEEQKQTDDINWINLGLDGQDATFTHWNASIIGHQGGHIGQRIIALRVTAGPGYPDDPPLVTFVQKVALPYVSATGQVEWQRFGQFRWTREASIIDALIAIRKSLEPKEIAQACARIPDGTTY